MKPWMPLLLLLLLLLSTASPALAWTAHYYPNDFDGDGISDLCVLRPSTYDWYCVPSSGSTISGWSPVGAGPGSVVQWGLPGDIIAPADYDGDRRTDPGVIRPSTMMWYIRKSTGGTAAVQLGLPGDLNLRGPLYIGGPDDFGVFRPSNYHMYCRTEAGSIVDVGQMAGGISGTSGTFGYFWANFGHFYTRMNSSTVRRYYLSCQTGAGTYVDYPWPSPGRLTAGAYLAGDVNYDYVHFQNDVWTIYPGGQTAVTPTVVTWGWGLAGDVPVKGDFDGDNRADLAVYNGGYWRVYSSGFYYGSHPPHMVPYGTTPGDYSFQWGLSSDIPIE